MKMNHQFMITYRGKSKVLSVEGTSEYAVSYISGYLQALRDRFGQFVHIRVQTKSQSLEHMTKKTRNALRTKIDQWD